ncbi:BolA family transcriptional regulator [Iodidimonas gelatinilytica]|uniref:BolA family transcriptional regulator n=1 Tax=Iodidimonas gelatinilytica TaxID=1236966 RepID=A0A5A7MV90_9PROT|nr:BolA family protein [Iodidimonas gelatinilytica]GEQ99243.1 BolA family transcriptional regulator [Iodidimonas gelatinilytica]
MTKQNASDQGLGPVGQALHAKLLAAFHPTHMDLRDESHKHVGHAGHRETGESHFHLEMESAQFAGKSAVARQRMVYALLAEDLREQVHALSLKLRAPEGF